MKIHTQSISEAIPLKHALNSNISYAKGVCRPNKEELAQYVKTHLYNLQSTFLPSLLPSTTSIPRKNLPLPRRQPNRIRHQIRILRPHIRANNLKERIITIREPRLYMHQLHLRRSIRTRRRITDDERSLVALGVEICRAIEVHATWGTDVGSVRAGVWGHAGEPGVVEVEACGVGGAEADVWAEGVGSVVGAAEAVVGC